MKQFQQRGQLGNLNFLWWTAMETKFGMVGLWDYFYMVTGQCVTTALMTIQVRQFVVIWASRDCFDGIMGIDSEIYKETKR